MNLLLLGPQGSGKGTQAKLIADAYDVPHVSTGEMLRDAIAREDDLGRRVQPIVDSGQLVPDELMIELVRYRLGLPDALGGFVLDGFPRTIPQAEALDTLLHELAKDLDLVLELQVPETVSINRLLERAEEEGRADDTPEAIRTRLALHARNAEALSEYYRARGILVGVHGDRPIPAVFAEVQQAVERAEENAA